MEWGFILCAGLGLFFLRDIWLWAAGHRAAYWATALSALSLFAGGPIAEQLSRAEAIAALSDSRFFGPAIGIHLLLAVALLWLGRDGRRSGRMFTLAALPAPVLFYSGVGANWWLLFTVPGLEGWTSGLTAAASWAAAAGGAGTVLRKRRADGVRGAGLRHFRDYAAALQLSCLLLLPLGADARTGEWTQAINWEATVLVYATTLLLAAGSFAVHRRRTR